MCGKTLQILCACLTQHTQTAESRIVSAVCSRFIRCPGEAKPLYDPDRAGTATKIVQFLLSLALPLGGIITQRWR